MMNCMMSQDMTSDKVGKIGNLGTLMFYDDDDALMISIAATTYLADLDDLAVLKSRC